jgi:hypothetical protein
VAGVVQAELNGEALVFNKFCQAHGFYVNMTELLRFFYDIEFAAGYGNSLLNRNKTFFA